jgi:hypothetical protein
MGCSGLDVSKEHIASIFRVNKYDKPETGRSRAEVQISFLHDEYHLRHRRGNLKSYTASFMLKITFSSTEF